MEGNRDGKRNGGEGRKEKAKGAEGKGKVKGNRKSRREIGIGNIVRKGRDRERKKG